MSRIACDGLADETSLDAVAVEEKRILDLDLGARVEDEGKGVTELGGVGVAYSDEFLKHKSPFGGHVERPGRLTSIVKALKETGHWKDLQPIPPRPATREELLLIHSKRYVNKLEKLETACAKGDTESLAAWNTENEDVFFNQHTVSCARNAVGSCLEAARMVVTGRIESAVAIVRPPGHHSESHCAQGFCVLNNVAITAKYAVETLGLKRVLVVDWDIHHGNGTQSAFLDDPRVMYFSVHRFDFGKFYPSLRSASAMTVGHNLAAGTNVNIAWNGKYMGDAEYLAAWDQVLLPIARQFDPELVIVSAGFDAAAGDSMGECELTPCGYALLTKKLQPLANGKLVLVLEGGYHLASLSASVAACVGQLLRRNEDAVTAYEQSLRKESLKESAIECIRETQRAHKAYWVF